MVSPTVRGEGFGNAGTGRFPAPMPFEVAMNESYDYRPRGQEIVRGQMNWVVRESKPSGTATGFQAATNCFLAAWAFFEAA